MATVTAPVRARRLFAGYLRPHRGSIGALAVGLVAATVLPLLGPQLLRHFVDAAIDGRPLHVLVAIAVVYLLIALGGQSLAVVTTYGASRLAWATTNQLREDVAEHALRLDMSFHAKRTAGEMIERVDGDVNALTEFLSQFVAQAIGSALLLVGALVLVWREDWRAGAVLTALVGGGVLTVWRGQRWAV